MRWRFAQGDQRTSSGSAVQEPKINSLMSKDPGEADDERSAAMIINDIEPSEAQHRPIESNARLVEWSDGSYALVIGDEVFDIRQEDLPESGIFLKHETDSALLKETIDQKIFVKPTVRSSRHVKQFLLKQKESEGRK